MKTNQRWAVLIGTFICILYWTSRAGAGVPAPALVNYQGVLRSPSGAPLSNDYNMVFRFFDVATGGTLILQDRHTNSDAGRVTVAGGLFTVQLGSGELRDGLGNLTPPGAFLALFRQHTDVYLEIQVEAEILSPRTRVVSAAYSLGGPRGILYTRWGKTTCSAGATPVYAGYAATGISSAAGPANQLCMASDPTWDAFSDLNQSVATIYGTEYQTGASGIPALASFVDEDAPCVVCYQPDADTVFMYPGRGFNAASPTSPTCPDGWRTEYTGYLMAALSATREAICMDRNPDTVAGGNASATGALWYTTESICGALPCPPYVNFREVTCSVCTR